MAPPPLPAHASQWQAGVKGEEKRGTFPVEVSQELPKDGWWTYDRLETIPLHSKKATMEYKEFLATTLPSLGLRWRRFRRRSIRKRVIDRMQQLNLHAWSDYQSRVMENEEERQLLTSMLTVTISRFWRNSSLFQRLDNVWLPALLESTAPEETVQIWSAGCASGEEPYSLLILWQESFASSGRRLRLLASDSDSHCLKRARQGRYPASSFREMPLHLRQKYFINEKGTFCLRHDLSQKIEWFEHNLIWERPPSDNHLIFCRNLVYTYFTDPLQKEITRRFHQALVARGFLVVGRKDRLPHGTEELFHLVDHPLYEKVDSPAINGRKGGCETTSI